MGNSEDLIQPLQGIQENQNSYKMGDQNSETANILQNEEMDPNEISPLMWLTMFKELNRTLVSLKTDIQGLQSIKGTVENFTITWKESVDSGLLDLETKNDMHEHKVKLLANIVIKQDERIKVLESRLSAVHSREIRPNVRISGILEKRNETREELFECVTSFFKKELEIEEVIEIADAYRIGTGNDRAIVVRLKYFTDKTIIFADTSKLKGLKNAKKTQYFVQEEQTEEQREDRQKYRELVRENLEKDENDRLKIKMAKGQIMVNKHQSKPTSTCTDQR